MKHNFKGLLKIASFIKRASPNANETVWDRRPISVKTNSTPITPVRNQGSVLGSDGIQYDDAWTSSSGVRHLDSYFEPKPGQITHLYRTELPQQQRNPWWAFWRRDQKTPRSRRARAMSHVRGMDSMSGTVRVRKRHAPGHNDAVPKRDVAQTHLPDNDIRRSIAYDKLRQWRPNYLGGKNFAMSSFWPEGTNSPKHALVGDGPIPVSVLNHETGHGINAGAFESEADYAKKDRLAEEIDAHVNGGSMNTDLARGALSTYAIPYYLREHPEQLDRFSNDILAKVRPEQQGLARLALAVGGLDGTNTVNQTAALRQYLQRVFPDRTPDSISFDDINNLATNNHLQAALDSPDNTSISNGAQYAQNTIGRPVFPIDFSLLPQELFDQARLDFASFEREPKTHLFGGNSGSRAATAASENPYLASILDYLSSDSHDNPLPRSSYPAYPDAEVYIQDLADYIARKRLGD